MTLRVRLTILAAAACSIGLFSLTDIPLGIPGEWTWNRIQYDHLAPQGVQRLASFAILAVDALAALAVLVAIGWAGATRIQKASRKESAGWLLALSVAGFAWLHSVQDIPPTGLNSARVPFVLYYPSSSGYFYKACYEVTETSEFLRHYEETVRKGDVLHEGTHPPGLVLFFRGLIWFADSAPQLASVPQVLLPHWGSEAFAVIRSTESRPFTERDQSVIWMAAMLTQLAAILVVVPLFCLLRLNVDRSTAWRTVCFWPLVPAIALFLPKSDVLFAFGSSLLVCLWLYAVRAAALSRESNAPRRAAPFLLGMLAGVVGWLGLVCSLAFLPAGAIAVAASVLLFREGSESELPSQARWKSQLLWSLKQHRLPLAGGVASFVMLTTLVALAWDLNLPRVWQLNYSNHARFYDVSPRSYLGWLLINPVELTLALGAPLAVMCGFGVLKAGRGSGDSRWTFRRLGAPELAVPVAVGCVWGLLWLTGKNSGEAARLWIPLMPLALWAGSSGWMRRESDSDQTNDSEQPSRLNRDWLFVLTVQALVCLATVFFVTGFLKEQSGLP